MKKYKLSPNLVSCKNFLDVLLNRNYNFIILYYEVISMESIVNV